MELSLAFVAIFLLQGTMVLLSYGFYAPSYDMWAILRDPVIFKIWSVSATLAAISFLLFTIYVFLNIDDTTAPHSDKLLLFYAYVMFLFGSQLYMPFAASKFVVLTLLVLALVAATTIYMVYISYILFGWNYASICILFLAIHCTLFDFVVWGYSWYSEMTQNEGEYVDIEPNENNINPLIYC